MRQYRIENISMSEEVGMKVWKTQYKEYDNFYNDVIAPKKPHPEVVQFAADVKDKWDQTVPATVNEAFSETNLEVRRLLFKAIGVEELFAKLEPELIHEKTLVKHGTRWDEKNKPFKYQINDKYMLYKIKGDKLFPDEPMEWRRANADIYAVRCWCSTTGREYWIYVPRNIGETGDALSAIAWTVQLPITNPECIYRQGDVIIAKASEASRPITNTSRTSGLTKEEYINLLVAAT